MRFSVPLLAVMGYVLSAASCNDTVKTSENKVAPTSEMTVAFYNVENLFDTKNDPDTKDEDFTPDGKLHWTEDKYETKLKHISEVLDAFPGDFPAIVGLCEIENKAVLEDLVKEALISGVGYAIVHQDSPDERGIDVALLYNPKLVSIKDQKFIKTRLPDDADPNTRDVLYVKAEVNGELLHLFVNHWPSRGGGQAETEPLRMFVAGIVSEHVKNILKSDSDARILLMGDFNDFPTDKSVAKVLNAGIESENVLFNYMYDDQKAGKGSHYYKGEWSTLDQFMGSMSLVNSKTGIIAPAEAAKIFLNPLVTFTDKEGNQRPNRTYVGDDYKAGYSDHLPIYITINY